MAHQNEACAAACRSLVPEPVTRGCSPSDVAWAVINEPTLDRSLDAVRARDVDTRNPSAANVTDTEPSRSVR
jgi:hypothetical protein